ELNERNDQLRGALDRQTATSEVLQIISSSPTEVTPVYEAIATAAIRVLDIQTVYLLVIDGDELQVVAQQAHPEFSAPGAGDARWVRWRERLPLGSRIPRSSEWLSPRSDEH